MAQSDRPYGAFLYYFIYSFVFDDTIKAYKDQLKSNLNWLTNGHKLTNVLKCYLYNNVFGKMAEEIKYYLKETYFLLNALKTPAKVRLMQLYINGFICLM